jgi:hypothetical protein
MARTREYSFDFPVYLGFSVRARSKTRACAKADLLAKAIAQALANVDVREWLDDANAETLEGISLQTAKSIKLKFWGSNKL